MEIKIVGRCAHVPVEELKIKSQSASGQNIVYYDAAFRLDQVEYDRLPEDIKESNRLREEWERRDFAKAMEVAAQRQRY